MGDFGDGDDDFFGFAAVFFGFGGEEECGCCDALDRKACQYEAIEERALTGPREGEGELT